MIYSVTKSHLLAIVSCGVLAALLCLTGVLPPVFSAHRLALPIILLFIAFWPVCMLAIRRAVDRSCLAMLGPALYAGLIASLMVSLFGKPFALALSPLITAPQLIAPAFWTGMLVAWAALESAQLMSVQQPTPAQSSATT